MSRSAVTDAGTAELPVQQGPAAPKERRFVYSGQPGGGQSEFMTRGNRPLKRRRKSPFKMVGLIAAVSIVIVFYVWNKITVNRLNDEIKQLESKQNVLNGNIARLKAGNDAKSELGRIEQIAKAKLGMIPNPEGQTFFEVENYPPAQPEGVPR